MLKKIKTNVGIIGLGIIGTRVARNLREAGFQVFVWNRTVKPAPNFMGSPAEVAQLSNIIQLFVADATALFETLDALGGSLTPQHTVICSATVDAGTILEAAGMVQAAGAKFLEAPFTGSRGAAEKRELVYFIGGDDETLRLVEPVLKATSKAIVKIGGLGHAAVLKIVTNIVSAVTVQALAEACAIIRHFGLDPNIMTKALEHHGVRSGITDLKLPKILARDYETHFSVKHMFKDVQLAIRAANNFDIDIPATTATAGSLYAGINQGWGDLDFSAVAKFYEQPGEPQPAEVPDPSSEANPEPPADEPQQTAYEVVPQEITPQPSQPAPVDEKPAEPEPKTEQKPAEKKTLPVASAAKTKPQLATLKPDKGKGWFGKRRAI